MRFTLYFLAFIATSILFFLFNWIYLADSFVLATFLISTFYFVFTKETKIDNPEDLKVAQVNNYQADRNSFYVYSMAIIVVVGGIVFWLLSPHVRSGLLLLPIWLLIIIVSNLAVRRQAKINIKSELLNYLLFTLGEEYPITKRYYATVTMIINKEIDEKDLSNSLIKISKKLCNFFGKFDVPEEKVTYYMNNFIKSLSQEELVSDEVKEMKISTKT